MGDAIEQGCGHFCVTEHVGSYPVEAVKMLGRIARQAEAARCEQPPELPSITRRGAQPSLEDIVLLNVFTTVRHLHEPFVFTPTETGATTRRIARFHLPSWIVALSNHHTTCQRLLFSYGVHLVYSTDDTRDWQDIACEWLQANKLSTGPLIFTQGPSRGYPGSTNRVEILSGTESC